MHISVFLCFLGGLRPRDTTHYDHVHMTRLSIYPSRCHNRLRYGPLAFFDLLRFFRRQIVLDTYDSTPTCAQTPCRFLDTIARACFIQTLQCAVVLVSGYSSLGSSSMDDDHHDGFDHRLTLRCYLFLVLLFSRLNVQQQYTRGHTNTVKRENKIEPNVHTRQT